MDGDVAAETAVTLLSDGGIHWSPCPGVNALVPPGLKSAWTITNWCVQVLLSGVKYIAK